MTTTIAGIALSIFAVCMIGIGIYGTRRTRTVNNFLLGGRKIGPWLSAFSYGTAYFSAVVFVGYAGMHGWNIGLASMWIGVGNALIGCAEKKAGKKKTVYVKAAAGDGSKKTANIKIKIK